MPLVSGRLDLHLVPPRPEDHPLAAARSVVDKLLADGVIDDLGGPGPRASWWIAGGFRRVRVDDPGHVVLYANQTGGFRVACPRCGASLVPTFREALTRFRAGGGRETTCPSCGQVSALEALRFAPEAAFGRLSLVTEDVAGATLAPDARRWVDATLPGWRTVLRRP